MAKCVSLRFSFRKNKDKLKLCSLGFEVKEREPFSIKKERWIHRVLKKIHLTSELSTGNEKMDKAFFFVTQKPSSLQKIFIKEEVLQALNLLFSKYQIQSIYCFNGKLWCTYTLAYTEMFDEIHLQPRLNALNVIANALDGDLLRPLATTSYLSPAKLSIMFMTAHAAMITLVLFALFPYLMDTMFIVNQNNFMHRTMSLGVFLSVLWFFYLFITLGGTSWFPIVLVDFIIFGIAGIIFSTMFLIRETNIELDTKIPTLLKKPVLSKSCALKCTYRGYRVSHTRIYDLSSEECATHLSRQDALSMYRSTFHGCGRRTLFLFSLTTGPLIDSDSEPFSFTTQEGTFDQVQNGGLMDIELHNGVFGYPWVDISTIKPSN